MYLSEDTIKEFARRMRETMVVAVPGHDHVYSHLFTDEVAEHIVRLLLEIIEAKRG